VIPVFYPGSAEATRQPCTQGTYFFAGGRDRRMYSVSALSEAANRRSLSFSLLRSAMVSAMFSTSLKSSSRSGGWQSEGVWSKITIGSWQSEGGFFIFISDAHSHSIASLRLQRPSKFASTRQNQKLHTVATNLCILGQQDVRRNESSWTTQHCSIAALQRRPKFLLHALRVSLSAVFDLSYSLKQQAH
jgi:hypothetical protein